MGQIRDRDRGCGDPAFHKGCEHAGWQPATTLDVAAVNAAREAATYASRDLGLDPISIRFFEPGPRHVIDIEDRSLENRLLIQLHAGWFGAGMLGKACHPETTPMPTVWVRVGLSPALTVAVVLHEARHVWQCATNYEPEDDEQDAEEYMWQGALRLGLSSEAVARAIQESRR